MVCFESNGIVVMSSAHPVACMLRCRCEINAGSILVAVVAGSSDAFYDRGRTYISAKTGSERRGSSTQNRRNDKPSPINGVNCILVHGAVLREADFFFWSQFSGEV